MNGVADLLWRDRTVSERLSGVIFLVGIAWYTWLVWLDGWIEPGTGEVLGYGMLALVLLALAILCLGAGSIGMVWWGGSKKMPLWRRLVDKFLPLTTLVGLLVVFVQLRAPT